MDRRHICETAEAARHHRPHHGGSVFFPYRRRLRIASMVRDLLQCNPVKADFTLYGSFAQTGRGHGMDKAW